MTNINITQNKNTVTVNGETRVVTVKVAGPQGPKGLELDETSKVEGSVTAKRGGTVTALRGGTVTAKRPEPEAKPKSVPLKLKKFSILVPPVRGICTKIIFLSCKIILI